MDSLRTWLTAHNFDSEVTFLYVRIDAAWALLGFAVVTLYAYINLFRSLTASKLRVESVAHKHDAHAHDSQFPVALVRSGLRSRYHEDAVVEEGAAVYLTAVLEYICTDILELASYDHSEDHTARGWVCKITGRKVVECVQPEDIENAVHSDQELAKLCMNMVEDPQPGQLSFTSSINLILKQLHPDTGISTAALGLMNCIINEVFEKLADTARKMTSKSAEAATGVHQLARITTMEMQDAVFSCLPDELAKHGGAEGTKAFRRWGQ